jgi:hypothetical protein
MIELKDGQRWKTRAGNEVVLSELQMNSGVFRTVGNIYLYDNEENGTFVLGTDELHDQDLIELVE